MTMRYTCGPYDQGLKTRSTVSEDIDFTEVRQRLAKIGESNLGHNGVMVISYKYSRNEVIYPALNREP